MTQIFVDLDGVLADFDAHYLASFGKPASKLLDDVDWNLVREHPDFYLNIPPMPDMVDLWRFVSRVGNKPPIILTGVPYSIKNVADQKLAWAARWLGPAVEVRCMFSREKCLHANPGDILIDDWVKYRHLWESKGGRWITHVSAADTIEQLQTMMEKIDG